MQLGVCMTARPHTQASAVDQPSVGTELVRYKPRLPAINIQKDVLATSNKPWPLPASPVNPWPRMHHLATEV